MEEAVQYIGEQIAQNPELYAEAINLVEMEAYSADVSKMMQSENAANKVRDQDYGFLGGKYGLLDGLWDGLTLPFNAIGDLLNGSGDRTWARDGTGISSSPEDDWYNIGYWMGAASGGGSAAGASSSARSRSKR